MARYKSRFSKQTFSEYLKLGLALKITKDCLHSLVETESQEFHQSVLQEIQGKPPCTECNIENILECPTAGLCKAKRCPFHTSSLKQPRQCPNGVCNIFRDRIRDAFRQYKSIHAEPSWRNTDVRQWCIDPFQLIKCFLPTGEYDEVNSTREIDLHGLLSVLLNNKRFSERLSDDLSKEDNICSEVVKIERVYRKCESLTLSEKEVFEYVDVLLILLEDPKFLLHQPKAKNAVENLKKLRKGTLQISNQEVTDILAEAIQTHIDDSMTKKYIRRITYKQQSTLRLKLLKDCHEKYFKKNTKIKTCQLKAFVSEEKAAINNLKEETKKVQEIKEIKCIEGITAVPLGKPAGYTSRQSSTRKRFSIRPNSSGTENCDNLKAVRNPSYLVLAREKKRSKLIRRRHYYPMKSCKVEPPEEYQMLKNQLRSPDKNEVFKKMKSLFFDTFLPNDSLNSKELDQAWKTCLCKEPSSAKKIADRLLSKHNFPEHSTLDRLCQRFGRRNELISKVCKEICVYIQSKTSKIVQIVPSYTTRSDNRNNIIFVVYTNDNLSRTELNEIKYSTTVRQTGKYSLAEQKIAYDGHVEKHRLSVKEIENHKKCINKHAASLLAKHKMLSIISPSPIRSTQDGLKIEKEPCIALYVRTKYYIPINEEPFETNYDGIPVDVREGEFITHPGSQSNADNDNVLKMGCQIGSLYGENSGTLGGFIEHPKYGLCGFTCAHVLLNSYKMNSLEQCGMINWPDFTPNEYVTQPAESSNNIGRLVQAVYTEGVAGQSGVEVALFQIERRRPNAGHFHGHDSMRFDSGKAHGFSRIGQNPVVKLGYTTKQTFGTFILNEPSMTVRAIDHSVDVGSCSLTLHNQLEVKSLDGGRFAYFGDSGSLVFMKGGEDCEYTCVGMVEGGTSYGTTIVTPIISILEAFNIPSLKNFETSTLFAEVENLRTEMQKSMCSIKQEISNIAARLPANQAGPSS